MSLWLVRAGSHGEYEQRFLDDNRIYFTWEGIDTNLSKLETRDEFRKYLEQIYPDSSKNQISNYTGQIWTFSHRIKVGDWIVLPSKHKSSIHFAEVKEALNYDVNVSDKKYRHSYKVNWLSTDIPRSNFDQDLLFSFGSLLTVCQIQRNDAEKRIHAMWKNNWKASNILPLQLDDTEEGLSDLSQVARDQIAKLILAKFKGHGMARLVNAVLEAQGYTTHVSPEGPDKGIDILAAPGPMGFGEPRVCVQVKSGDTPLDHPTLNQLIGAMQNVQAKQGLLVSWSGFKTTVDKEKATQFFRVRLWDRDDLIEQLLDNYGKLDDSIRAELPLKRIWTVAYTDSED